jgi:hypothetical protein
MILETRGTVTCNNCGNNRLEVKKTYIIKSDYNNKYDHMFNLTDQEVTIVCPVCNNVVFKPKFRESVKLNYSV